MWKLTPLQRNIIIVIALGIVIRYILGVLFTYPRDIASWVVNSENFLMGGGLYGLPGHYYTPVWGYIMAVLTSIAAFTGIPISQYVPDFSGATSALPWYRTSDQDFSFYRGHPGGICHIQDRDACDQ